MYIARLRIKEIAKRKKMSMGRLSRTSDVSYKTIKLVYADPEKDIYLSTLVKIAIALKVNVEDLFEIVFTKDPEEDQTESFYPSSD